MVDVLPKTWQLATLERCMDAIVDYRGKSPTKTASGIPLITAKIVKGGCIHEPQEFIGEKDFKGWMRRGLPEPGDVLITTEAPLGEVAQLDGRRVALAQRLIALRGKRATLDNTFLKFTLQSDFVQAQLRARATGTTVLGIRQSELRKILLRLPPFSEQRVIAGVLGAFDDKIELNRRMSKTLETMARAIFKSWFVDFDPVRAKSDGRDPRMPTNLGEAFPGRLVRTKSGEAPEGWTRAGIGSWVDVLSGGTPREDPGLWEGDIPWISPKVMTAIHADEPEKHVSMEAIGNGTRLSPAGSVLVMVRGMGLHDRVRVSQARRDVAFNQDVKALVPRHIESSLLLFALLELQDELLTHVDSAGHGTGRLPTEVLLAHQITMPPRSLQIRLAGVFDKINDQIACARDQSRAMATVRDVLLPKLISGEVRFSDAERIVGKHV